MQTPYPTKQHQYNWTGQAPNIFVLLSTMINNIGDKIKFLNIGIFFVT